MNKVSTVFLLIIVLFSGQSFCTSQLQNDEYDNKKLFEKKLFISPINPDSVLFVNCDFILKEFGDDLEEQRQEFLKFTNKELYKAIIKNAGNVTILPQQTTLSLSFNDEDSYCTAPLQCGKRKKSPKINYIIPNSVKLKENSIDADFCFVINTLKFIHKKTVEKEITKIETSYIFWDYEYNKPIAHGFFTLPAKELTLKKIKWSNIYSKLTQKIFNKSPFPSYNPNRWYLEPRKVPVLKDTNSIIIKKGTISRASVFKHLKPSLIKLEKLFSHKTKASANLSGKLYLKITIGKDGNISEHTVIFSSFYEPSDANSIINKVLKCNFSGITNLNESVEVLLPFSINPVYSKKGKSNPALRVLSLLSLTIAIIFFVRTIKKIPQY